MNQITGKTCKIWQTRQAQTFVLSACFENLSNKITAFLLVQYARCCLQNTEIDFPLRANQEATICIDRDNSWRDVSNSTQEITGQKGFPCKRELWIQSFVVLHLLNCSGDGGSNLIRNVGTYKPIYTASPIKLGSSVLKYRTVEKGKVFTTSETNILLIQM
jgi:hypothetical protein